MARLSRSKQALCDRFNTRHPIGSKIFVWTGLVNDGPPKERLVKAPGAYIAGGHTPVVQVAGGGGCVALTHVRRDR